ncbi:galactose oxidase-like domain-containing protein [Rhizobium sp. L1K21]|uniref:galactose oxidase-like domain-containing protein n=1 Tax=Rhizobium sp. L1K21 TaxID=2954933 RepID=UPI002092B421|nr:LamG-like jellyroll fold domain-containing protein [Rhizobium sp. L1K21]MCO6187920.1 DUF1929 domain-containing protein [Rhizobium sp. L1K21]
MAGNMNMGNVQYNTGERGAVVISDTDTEGNGEWSNVVALTIIPLHSIVLPDGKILSFGSTEEGMQGGDFVYSIFDPTTGVEKVLENTTATNIFCSNMALDPETGNVIIFGGDGNRNGGGVISGIDSVTVFDYRTQTMSEAEPMEYARWYPSNITLANGDILVLGGRDRDYNGSTIPEVYDGATGTFRQLTGAEMPDLFGGGGSLYESWWYPHVWQNSKGEVIVVEAQGDDIYRLSTEGNGSVEKIGKTGFESYKLNTGSMYDTDKIAIIGDDGGIYVADISDLSHAPIFEKVATLENARTNAAMISLPDGRVLIVGGSTPYGDNTDQGNGLTNAVYTPTVWDPSDNSITQMDEQAMARLYHSSGLLLPDGSVWSGGGGAPGPQVNTNVEFFNPDYLYGPDGALAERPEITGAPKNIEAGDTFRITVDDTSDISMVSAIRSGAMTHARNLDSRFVKLDFTIIDGTTIEIRTPHENVMGPGAWMTYVVDTAGVPSEASIIGVNMVEIFDTPPIEQTTLTYFDIDQEQINGAFELTVDARFDDLGAGIWQRVFDFGNGPASDNIWLGQAGGSNDMRFEIFVGDTAYAITAQNAIEQGVRAEWKVSIDEDGMMRMWKNGALVAEGQGAVPRDVERVQNYIGDSNWVADTRLVGEVRNLEIENAPEPLTVYNIEEEQIDGAFSITVEARFDDLGAGNWQRVFDFGNGPQQDNIWLGQAGNSDDMRFEIFVDGQRYEITAADAIVEGVRAEWKVAIDDAGMMRLWKDGALVAEGQGVVPADVERTQNYIGDSNWEVDTTLVGEVRNLVIENHKAEPEPTLVIENIEDEQIDGAFSITVEARFDDLGAGNWQRVFDFGNGPQQDNIWLGQAGNSDDMRFEIFVDGQRYEITAADAIVEGVRAEWKVAIDDAGMMRLWKDGALVAEGQGVVPADVERTQNYIGDSNWEVDTTLVGEVRNLVIENHKAEPEPTLVIENIEDEQIDGAFSITVEARFDDLGAGNWQRVFDFGNGPQQDNIWLGQAGNSDDMRFEIFVDGQRYEITAADAIVEGVRAEWKVAIDDAGMMRLWKDGALVAEGQGVVPADVERTQNYIGDSNWEADATLVGEVRNLVIDNTVPDVEILPTLSIAADGDANEGDANTQGALFYTLTLDQASDADVTADVTISGGATGPSTITIPAGQTSGQIELTFNGDDDVDGNETVVVSLVNLVGATGSNLSAAATIIDDDEAPTGLVIYAGDQGGQFYGTTGDDVFNGGAGLDVFIGDGGNDYYDGGGGYYNQVDYSGAAADYSFTRNVDGTVTVSHPSGGIDTLKNIDGLWFAGESKWYALNDLVPVPPDSNGDEEGYVIDAGDNGGYFYGTTGDDIFNGGAGVDVFHGGLGDDTYDGAGGYYNQVDFDGNRADYQFTENADGTITAIHATYGEDVLKNIDGVWFTGDEAWVSVDDLTSSS